MWWLNKQWNSVSSKVKLETGKRQLQTSAVVFQVTKTEIDCEMEKEKQKKKKRKLTTICGFIGGVGTIGRRIAFPMGRNAAQSVGASEIISSRAISHISCNQSNHQLREKSANTTATEGGNTIHPIINIKLIGIYRKQWAQFHIKSIAIHSSQLASLPTNRYPTPSISINQSINPSNQIKSKKKQSIIQSPLRQTCFVPSN